MTAFDPTPEQSAILAAPASRNLMITAYAGCGKTATLCMIDAATPGPNLLLCFNRTVALEAERRVKPTTTVRTLNSLGHRVWSDACAAKLTLNPKKQSEIFRALVDNLPAAARKQWWAHYDTVIAALELGRALGYIPHTHAKANRSLCNLRTLIALLDETPTDFAIEIINTCLLESIRQAYAGVIDFPDQTYMAALFATTYPRFALVLIDEYQDLSPVNHEMVRKLCKTSRQIGVGDAAQAIYAFRGADHHGMDRAVSAFDMLTLPLSVSFRCPEAIVRNVRWRVPDFKASRDGGSVCHFDPILPTTGAVLSRNNAPLIALAMRSIYAGVGVNVSGGDIGSKLTRTLTKLGPGSMTSTQAIDAIDHWESSRLAAGSVSAADTAECLRILTRQGTTLDVAIAHARHLFAERTAAVTYSTVHKAKGLEWPTVYHLDAHLCTDRDQDPNIRYVADTRSSDRLTYLESGNYKVTK